MYTNWIPNTVKPVIYSHWFWQLSALQGHFMKSNILWNFLPLCDVPRLLHPLSVEKTSGQKNRFYCFVADNMTRGGHTIRSVYYKWDKV